MIKEFFQKCNFDNEVVIVSSTAQFKPEKYLMYETSVEFDNSSFA